MRHIFSISLLPSSCRGPLRYAIVWAHSGFKEQWPGVNTAKGQVLLSWRPMQHFLLAQWGAWPICDFKEETLEPLIARPRDSEWPLAAQQLRPRLSVRRVDQISPSAARTDEGLAALTDVRGWTALLFTLTLLFISFLNRVSRNSEKN